MRLKRIIVDVVINRTQFITKKFWSKKKARREFEMWYQYGRHLTNSEARKEESVADNYAWAFFSSGEGTDSKTCSIKLVCPTPLGRSVYRNE